MAVPEPRRSDVSTSGQGSDSGGPASHVLGRAVAAIGGRRLLAVALLVLAVILGLTALRHTHARDEAERDYCDVVIDQAVADLAAFLKDYEDATFQFVANQDLNRLLLDCVSSADPYEIAPYNQAFSNFLEGYTFSRRGVYDAVFLDESNRNRKALTMRESLPASYIKALRNSDAYQDILRADGKAVWAFEENCAHTGMDCVIVGRRIKDLFGGKPLGVVAVMICADELVRVVNDYLYDHFYFSVGTVKTNYTVVADSKGNIISGPSLVEGLSLRQLYSNSIARRAEGSFTDAIRGEDVLVVFRPVSGADWRVFVPVSLAGLYGEEPGGARAGVSIPMAGGLVAGALAATAVFLFAWPMHESLSSVRIARAHPDYLRSSQVSGASLADDGPQPSTADPEWLGQLTDKEIQVLILMSQGYSNREIAQKTYIAEQTVKNYVSSVYSKLCVRDRVQASLLAVEAGLNLRDYRDLD